MTTNQKIAIGRTAALEFASANGNEVNSRAIRPALASLGLLDGGDERWIGFIFNAPKTFEWTGRTTGSPDKKLRRSQVKVWAVIPQ